MENILSKLSQEQKDAILDPSLRKCILAGAGSGKTGTLVSSIILDLHNGIEPKKIIAFTFTEKAANELLGRINRLSKKLLPDKDISGIYIGTIHSWCHHFLRNLKEYRGYEALDELQIDSLISRLYDKLGIEKIYNKPFPRGIEPFLEDLEIFYNEHIPLSTTPEPIKRLLETFLNILKENKLLTFGGMVRYATEELIISGPVSDLNVLYVDEYQDVNNAQVELIKAMISPETKLVVVGDDLQCIYNWRGSNVSRILNFPSEFNNTSVRRLNANFRSRPNITLFANLTASNIKLRDKSKQMIPMRENENVAGVYWFSSSGTNSEVEDVVKLIQGFQKSGVPLNNIAILLRSVLGSGQEFRDALIQSGIKVNSPILSRAIEFIFTFLVPLFTWLIKEDHEPRNKTEEDELRIEASNLWEAATLWINELNENSELTFWEEVAEWNSLIINKKNEAYNVRGQLYNLLDKIGIKVDNDAPGLIMGLSIASQIIRSVEEIHRRRLKHFERRTPSGLISEIIISLRRNANSFGESLPLEYGTEGVLITTIHQAKGLEWPIVIVPRLITRRFPLQNSRKVSSFSSEINQRYSTKIDDEYRLFYVACTRAKERLFLSDPCEENIESRSIFLKNIRNTTSFIPQKIENLTLADFTLISEKQEISTPLEIGLSDLLIYLSCPYQYALSRVAKIQPSVGDELGYGKGLHEIIQRRIDENTNWDKEKILRETEEGVHLPLMSLEAENQSKKAIYDRIYTLQDLGVFQEKSISEIEIATEIDNSIITGKIDGITQRGDNNFIIKDWKSSIHEVFIERYEKQLQFYAYALTKKDKKVIEAELIDISKTTLEKKLNSRKVDISQKSEEILLTDIKIGIKKLRNNDFSPTPTKMKCSGCDMQRICNNCYIDEKA